MVLINLDNIYKSYGLEEILKGFSLSLNQGERVGLIGPNGSGKTTLFKIIADIEEYQAGVISMRRNKEVGYLSQMPDFDPDNTLYEELEEVFADIILLQKELADLEKEIANLGKAVKNDNVAKDQLQDLMSFYSEKQEIFEQGIGYEYQSKIRQVAAGLGFDEEDLSNLLVKNLSGGEKTRLGLARLLLKEPDLLLLDEPTNHLDLAAIQWLESYLNNYQGTILIISHDRYFLDRVITRLVEIKNGRAEEYAGNYSFYLKERKNRYEQKLKAYKNQQKKIKELEDAIEQLFIWGRSRDSEKMFKRAKAMQKRLDRIERLDKPTLSGQKMNLSLDIDRLGGQEVLQVENLTKGFADEDNLLAGLDLKLYRGEKAAIIGGNGTGKTTLLKMIMGYCPADKGKIKIGANIRVGYYSQEFSGFNPDDDLITAIRSEIIVSEVEARNLLASFLFTGEDVFKKIGNLSGGEKSRLRLLQLMYGDYNFLILDEPTNHLDLPSREVLESAIQNYAGTVLVVSHDRYFLNKVVDFIYDLEAKQLTKYYGDYDYYKEKKEDLSKIKKNGEDLNQANQGKIAYERQKKARRKKSKQKKTIKLLEEEIIELEAKQEKIEKEMTIEANTDDYNKLQDLEAKYHKISEQLEKSYQEWENYI